MCTFLTEIKNKMGNKCTFIIGYKTKNGNTGQGLVGFSDRKWTLKYVDLSFCGKITNSGIKALQIALPELEIER